MNSGKGGAVLPCIRVFRSAACYPGRYIYAEKMGRSEGLIRATFRVRSYEVPINPAAQYDPQRERIRYVDWQVCKDFLRDCGWKVCATYTVKDRPCLNTQLNSISDAYSNAAASKYENSRHPAAPVRQTGSSSAPSGLPVPPPLSNVSALSKERDRFKRLLAMIGVYAG